MSDAVVMSTVTDEIVPGLAPRNWSYSLSLSCSQTLWTGIPQTAGSAWHH